MACNAARVSKSMNAAAYRCAKAEAQLQRASNELREQRTRPDAEMETLRALFSDLMRSEAQGRQRLEKMQPPCHGPPEHVEGELARLCRPVVGGVHDRDLERVRVQVRRLAVQQHGVHAVESLHIPPPVE